MANKQIKDFTLKTVPDNDDKLLIQDGSDVTKYITVGSLHQLKAGFFNYNDATTISSPIAHNGSEGFKKLTNDGAGPQTELSYKPTSMTTLWNTVTSQFNFSELGLGDMIDLRVDVNVTTSTPNQEVVIRIDVAIGTIGNFQLELDRRVFKNAGVQPMISYTGGWIGSDFAKDSPAEVQLDTDASATIVVQGWYAKITRR